MGAPSPSPEPAPGSCCAATGDGEGELAAAGDVEPASAPRAYVERGVAFTAEAIRRLWCDSTYTRLAERDGTTYIDIDARELPPARPARGGTIADLHTAHQAAVDPHTATTQLDNRFELNEILYHTLQPPRPRGDATTPQPVGVA